MSKKKIIILVSVCILILLVIAGVVIFKAIFSKEYEIKKNAKSTIDCIICSDYSGDFYYINMLGEFETELDSKSEFASTMISNIKYELKEVTINQEKGYATIQAEFETVDMQELLYQFSEYEYNEENQNMALSKLIEKDYKTKTFDVELIMIENDGKWYLYESPEFNNVLTGGLYSLYMDMENTFSNQFNEGEN